MPNKPRTKLCINCGQSFTYQPRYKNDELSPRLYCTISCSNRFRKRERKGQPHPPATLAALAASEAKPSDAINPLLAGRNAEGEACRRAYLKEPS